MDRCLQDIQKDATDHCARHLAAKGHAFRDECLAMAHFFVQAEINCRFGNPVFLSGMLLCRSILRSGCCVQLRQSMWLGVSQQVAEWTPIRTHGSVSDLACALPFSISIIEK